MLKKKLSDILLTTKLVDQEQLNECMEEQQTSGKMLEQILLDRKIISKADLARALAEQINFPFLQAITESMTDINLLRKIPLKFLRQHVIIPIMFEARKTIVTADPRDLQPLDDLALLIGGEVRYAVAAQNVILDAINKYYPLETGKEMMKELSAEEGEIGISEEIEERDILEMANEAPIIKLVNHILYQAAKEGASDIHIEPFEKELRIRYRIDGNMYQRVIPPKRYQSAIVSRIKIMAHLNIAEKRIPQDGRISIKVADKSYDIRVSILPTNFGERVVMRLQDKSRGIVEIEAFGMSQRDYDLLTRIIERPNGIILVSGPTGSGKTTTLYSILHRLNQPDVNLITVEDPVEYTIHGINQVQVHEKIGLTFAAALRSILRQDPDVILIGEIRDLETAEIAIQAALTGHLVLSTIHTNNAPATVTRLVDMGVQSFLIGSSLVCVIAQRLIRTLCNACKQPFQPDEEMIKRVGLSLKEAKEITFYNPVGCDECLKTGYKGRMVIFEIMEVDDAIARLITMQASDSAIRDQAIKQGMTLLGVDGIRAIKSGRTTIEEVMAVAYLQAAEEPLPPISGQQAPTSA